MSATVEEEISELTLFKKENKLGSIQSVESSKNSSKKGSSLQTIQSENESNSEVCLNGLSDQKQDGMTINPPKKLRELLEVFQKAPPGNSRRMNALGALKILAAIPANRARLARTHGVIPSLLYCLCHKKSSFTEQQRSVTALLHLISYDKNRSFLYHCNGFSQGIATALKSKCPKTSHIASHCISRLSKCDEIKVAVSMDMVLMNAMLAVLDETCDKKNGTSIENMISKEDPLKESAKLFILATFRQLLKSAEAAVIIVRIPNFTNMLARISCTLGPAPNAVCAAVFADLTRHPKNSLYLVYQANAFVPALVKLAASNNSESRKYACFGIQNLSCNTGCRQQLATTSNLLSVLTACSTHGDQKDEQTSALIALKNLCGDPSNFIHIANTSACAEGIISLANLNDNSRIQYEACDTLLTMSHWIMASAIAGMRQEDNKYDTNLPTGKTSTWEQWQ